MGQEIGQYEEWNHNAGSSAGNCCSSTVTASCRRWCGTEPALSRQPALYEVDFDYTRLRVDRLRGLAKTRSSRSCGAPTIRRTICCSAATSRRCRAQATNSACRRRASIEEILNTDSELFGGSNVGNWRAGVIAPECPGTIGRTASRSRCRRWRWWRSGEDSAASLMAKYDAIIIGGGHNGLVTAAYLARAGSKVLVLERREMVGGCAVTEEIWPGYRVSTGAYLTSLLQERIVRESGTGALRLSGGCQGSGVLLRLSRRPPSLLVAGPSARRWRKSRNFRARDAEVFPAYEASSGADLAAWWNRCC